MTTFLTIIFYTIIIYAIFVVSPLGVYLTIKQMDSGKPACLFIAMFILIIPALIIGSILGIIT